MIAMLKRFGLMAAVSTLFLVLLGTGVFAAPAGDFEVTGDQNSYSFSGTSGTDGVLTITGSGDFTITNTDPNTATSDRIIVKENVTANITLKDVNISMSYLSFGSSIEIEPHATANITLIGTNKLSSTTSCAGLQVLTDATLNITSNSTGSLESMGGNNAAGIGGSSVGVTTGDCGNITISGGTVTAIGGAGAAGIGGGVGAALTNNGKSGNGGNIIITGGTVKATGGSDDFNASATAGGAGIGGGGSGDIPGYISGTIGGDGGTITITGGYVEATGTAPGAAGIGGGAGLGKGGAGSNVIISGGVVKATGIDIGIGPGTTNTGSNSGADGTFSTTYLGNAGTATISATGGTPSISGLPTVNLSGIILNGNDGRVYGNQTLSTELTIASTGSLTINSSDSLIIENGGSLILEDGSTFNNQASLNVLSGGSFRLIDNVSITGSGTINYAEPLINIADNSIVFVEDGGKKQFYFKSVSGYPITYTGNATITGATRENNVTVLSGEHNITLDSVDIDQYRVPNSNPINVGGNPTDPAAIANITLINNNFLLGGDNATALNVMPSSTVHITAASTGQLIAEGGSNGAGIGGAGGNVIIAGGTVNAQGKENAAGIGAGQGGAAGTVNIISGTITAIGGDPLGSSSIPMLSAFTAKPTLSPLPGTTPIVEASRDNIEPMSTVSTSTDYHTNNKVQISFGPTPTPTPTPEQTNNPAIAPLTGVYFEVRSKSE